jgi:hypothetical protein
MSSLGRQLLQLVLPILFLSIIFASAISLFILFSYALVWGIFIFTCLWLIATLKRFFFPAKTIASKNIIIDHDEYY